MILGYTFKHIIEPTSHQEMYGRKCAKLIDVPLRFQRIVSMNARFILHYQSTYFILSNILNLIYYKLLVICLASPLCQVFAGFHCRLI